MINPGAQLTCKSRAAWQLQTGRPAKTLSPNYRLDCDFGTAVIITWKEGGGEPIYVCDSHAKELGRSRDHGPDAYVITDQSNQRANQRAEQTGNPPIPGDRRQEDRRRENRRQEDQASPELFSNSTKHEDRAQSALNEALNDATKDAPKDERSTGAKSDAPASVPIEPSVVEPKLADTKVARSFSDTKVAPSLVETKPMRATINKPYARDLTFGNAAKAMVDEAIWNMDAGGQLAVIRRKINDYTPRLEAIFSNSKITISVEEFIDKPLEQAALDIIDNRAMSDSEKDAAIQQLGALQEWVKQGLRGDITPLQANRMLLAIGGRLDWGGNSDISEDAKPVYRALYSALKTAICKADPEAQNLHDRITNLYAAMSEMQAR